MLQNGNFIFATSVFCQPFWIILYFAKLDRFVFSTNVFIQEHLHYKHYLSILSLSSTHCFLSMEKYSLLRPFANLSSFAQPQTITILLISEKNRSLAWYLVFGYGYLVNSPHFISTIHFRPLRVDGQKLTKSSFQDMDKWTSG